MKNLFFFFVLLFFSTLANAQTNVSKSGIPAADPAVIEITKAAIPLSGPVSALPPVHKEIVTGDAKTKVTKEVSLTKTALPFGSTGPAPKKTEQVGITEEPVQKKIILESATPTRIK